MKRREFLNWLGLGGAALAIDPSRLFAVEVYKDYPRLHFTGMKPSQDSCQWAGQFLWTVHYEDTGKTPGQTFWYCNLAIHGEDLWKSSTIGERRRFIRVQLENGAMTVAKMMDGIVVDALGGRVQTGQYERLPNPDFDPSLPATHSYDDDDEVWNPKTIQGPPIYKAIRSMAFAAFDEALAGDAWDIDRVADQIMNQIGPKFA